MPARSVAKARNKTTKKQAEIAPARIRTTARPAAKKLTTKKLTATRPAAAKPAPAKTKAARPAAKPPRRAPETKELRKFRELLLAERARLLAELEEIEERTSRATDAERATELSSYEDHPADLASETFEREKDIAIAESVESLLNQVNTALEKVDRGTYGICDACGRPIKKARLQALPFATLCLECQGRLES